MTQRMKTKILNNVESFLNRNTAYFRKRSVNQKNTGNARLVFPVFFCTLFDICDQPLPPLFFRPKITGKSPSSSIR